MTSNIHNPGNIPPRIRRPIAIDLFSGAGGMSLGFEQAGYDVVAAIEYDPVHAATHLFNFPMCEVVCRDVSKLSSKEILAAAERGFKRIHPKSLWEGRIDTIIGGPPCQGFSTGGKRDSNDARNNLVLEFVRIVEQLRPQTFCLENVAGLLEEKFVTVRAAAFSRLRSAGYSLSGTTAPVNSARFGVPQNRRRVIVMGNLNGPEPQPPAEANTRLTVRDAFEGLPSPLHYPQLLSGDAIELNERDIERRLSINGDYALGLSGRTPIKGSKSRPRLWNPDTITGSRRTVHTTETIRRFEATSQGEVEPVSRLYRLSFDGVSRTLRAGTGSERGAHTSPRPIHPVENRVITVREAARLHGYPDWFRFHTTNWHGHRQVGNSVPPPLARAAGESLLNSIEYSPGRLRRVQPLGNPSLLRLSRVGAASLLGAQIEEIPAPRARRQVD